MADEIADSAEETTFAIVVGTSVFDVAFRMKPFGPRMEIDVSSAGSSIWHARERAWRPPCVGLGSRPYLWTAQTIAVLPDGSEGLQLISLDEPILFVFEMDKMWLVVCEISVRLLGASGEERAQVVLPEVIQRATWDDGVLGVECAQGDSFRFLVDHGQLVPAHVMG
jgi:hypothetical protein